MTRMDGNEGTEPPIERNSVQHDVTRSEPLSTAVVAAVASATGVEPIDLPPLYDSIEPDALDDIFREPNGTGDVRVWFIYADCDVLVEGGTVTVEPRPKSRPSRAP